MSALTMATIKGRVASYMFPYTVWSGLQLSIFSDLFNIALCSKKI